MFNRIKQLKVILLITVLIFGNIGTYAFAEEENTVVSKEYPAGPAVTAGAAILMDADTGAILYEKDAHGVYYPASITKIMTCLLAIENLSLEDTITFTNDIFDALPYDAALLGVKRGETLTVKDCLYGLMLRSGNEVAVALATAVSGSEEAFGRLMTERAKEMGALNTVFTNASGLYQDTHHTTAYDMAVITRAALKNGTFCQVWGSESYEMSATNMSEPYTIWNRHNMLVEGRAEYYEYAAGGKTGYEELAKRTLVTHAKKGDLSLIAVVLYDEVAEAYIDTENLLDYGFSNFRKARVSQEETRFGGNSNSIFVKYDSMFDGSTGFISLPETDYVTIPNDMQVSELEYKIEYNKDNTSGNVAEIKYYVGEHYLGQTVLTFRDDVIVSGTDNENQIKKVEKKRENVYVNIWYIIGGIVVILGIIVYIIILNKTRKGRKIKRDRKKLFREAGRKYRIKKRRKY